MLTYDDVLLQASFRKRIINIQLAEVNLHLARLRW